MILSNEQLRAALTGTAEIQEKNGRLVPLRFGRHVRDAVYPAGTRFHGNVLQTAGVTARFATDSDHLCFGYWASEKSASHTFDVYVNQTMRSSVQCTQTEGRFELALPAGEKTVTIYFPYHCQGRIFDVTLADGASFSLAPAPTHRILFIGDSITHGVHAECTSMTYPHQVARMLNAEIVNQGIGGEGFNPLSVDEQLPFAPDLISVAYGTNDWSHAASLGDLVGVANGHLAHLAHQYPDVPRVAILPIWRADNHLIKATGSFSGARAVIREAAERFGYTVVDGLSLVPHDTAFFADARLHPNALGFQFYAEHLAEVLHPLLNKENIR